MTYSVLKVPLNPNQPTNLSQAGHMEFASEADYWLKTVRSEDSLCS